MLLMVMRLVIWLLLLLLGDEMDQVLVWFEFGIDFIDGLNWWRCTSTHRTHNHISTLRLRLWLRLWL